MSVDSHIEQLKLKHKTLSDEIEKAQNSPSISDHEMTEMKKRKLQLKEEIERLSATA